MSPNLFNFCSSALRFAFPCTWCVFLLSFCLFLSPLKEFLELPQVSVYCCRLWSEGDPFDSTANNLEIIVREGTAS